MNADAAGGLVGRTAELAQLAEAVTDLLAGRGGSLLIEGEPGIGKSALLAAGLAGLGNRVPEALQAGCDELGRRFPLAVLTQLLGVQVRSPDPRRSAAARALARSAAPDASEVGPSPGDPVAAAAEELVALVHRLCSAGPVLLAVEDLHWADAASLEVWRRLTRVCAQLPLLLVATCRPVPLRPELPRLREDVVRCGGFVLPLGPLAEEGVTALAARQVGGAPGPRLRRRLELAAGNPLYVQELLDALTRGGALRESGGRVDLAEAGAADAAVSLSDAIADRLDFLSEQARDLLRPAALLGPDFSLADLAAVAEREPSALAGVLEEACSARVLERVGDRLRFRHGLLREALYGMMPVPVRDALHRHAAQVAIASGAPVERVAELILPVLDTVHGWELDWLAANAGVLAARAPAVAAALLEHALADLGYGDPRLPVLEDQLAAVDFVLARHEDTERITRGILARTSDPHRTGQAVWYLGYTLLMQRRVPEAEQRVAAASADERVAPEWRARLTALRAMILPGLGRFAEAVEAAEAALAEGERLGDPPATAYALHSLSMISHAGGDTATSVAQIERALALTADRPDLTDLHLILLGNRAAGLDTLGESGRTFDSLALARDLAERIGSPRLAMLRIKTAERAFDTGRWDEALAELEAITELPDPVRDPLHRSGLEALIAVHREDRERAGARLAGLGRRPVSSDMVSVAVYGIAACALDLERAGRAREAAAVLAPLLTADFEENLPSRSDWLPLLVRLALAAGDEELARSAADACAVEAERVPLPVKRAAARWCRGLVDADPAELLAAAEHFRAAGRRPLLGEVLEDAAVLTARGGDTGTARALASKALAVYTAMDAVADARRTAARLRACGIRLGVRGSRQRAQTGWEALTATERAVAELVAEGCANPEIATRMRLSRRTVETHVSHILTKLGVRSRQDVAPRVPRRPAGSV